jgi:signal transduction histidine kinase
MRFSIFERLNLSVQFLLFSLVILLAGMVSIGVWIHHEIEEVVTHRTAEVTALYVNSFVAPLLQDFEATSALSPSDLEVFDELLTGTALGRDVVSFKLWSVDGTILYSRQDDLIGLSFAHSELEQALGGDLVAELSDLTKPDNVYERQQWGSLIETYAPVTEENGQVVAVAEFYQDPEHLLSDIGQAQTRSWLFVGAATLVMYLLLVTRVRRVSNTIESQRNELEGNVMRLRDLLSTNKKLQDRMQAAAGRTTALNEQYLHRISADLHDGPAQNLALALLRLEGPDEASTATRGDEELEGLEDLSTVRSSLDSALKDIRSIASGLRLPEIEDLSLTETALRVLKEFERATGREVEFRQEDVPSDAPLPLKITVYRVLQEALANSFRHGHAAFHGVTLTGNGGTLALQIVDDGAGFDPESVSGAGALGLMGMRERVKMLGGRFEVAGRTPTGTAIRVSLPLANEGGPE